jgi:hypothetical protein
MNFTIDSPSTGRVHPSEERTPAKLCKLPNRERTCQMVALTRDFDVFASRVTTRISAVLFPIAYIAKAWDVRALFRLLIRHHNSVLSGATHFSDPYSTTTLDTPRSLYQPE